MNPVRFARKLLTDPQAAWASAKLVGRAMRGRLHWGLSPRSPLTYRLKGGGRLLLEPGHSFTHCFWPGVDAYEPDVREFLRWKLRPGDTFIDCGANVGYFSVLAGAIVGKTGRVVSIEANPLTFKLLERNLKANGLADAVHCALTSQGGEVEIHMPEGGDVYSSIRTGGLASGPNMRSWKVSGRTLDDVIAEKGLDRVDVVKIDIEGGELDVLRSARRCMEQLRPTIITEYGTNTWPAFGAAAADLKSLAAERGYDLGLFDPQTRSIVPTTDETWGREYCNIVMTPAGR